MFQAYGYTLTENAAKYVAIMADLEAKGEFNFGGWIVGQLFVRFSLDHFYYNSQKVGGDLPFESLKECLPWMGVEDASDEEAKRLFTLADADGNGTIDAEEFLIIIIRLKHPDRTASLDN